MAIAIVGSGPAGFYTADLLSRSLPQEPIHLFERLALPYGLVRYGVAPDHPGTKAVARLFARVMKRPNMSFFGNVEVGRDVCIDSLEEAYDLVIVASGAGAGRQYKCPGIEQACNLTGLELSSWFNGMPLPGNRKLPARLDSICIIGNGNVALDAARLLTKPAPALLEAGVPESVMNWREGLGLEAIHICGRRNAAQTRFSVIELEELEALSGFRPVVDAVDLEGVNGHNTEALHVLQRYSRQAADLRSPIRFHFEQEVQRYQAGKLQTTSGSSRQAIPALLIVHAIGQRAAPIPGLPFDLDKGCISNQGGLVEGKARTYVVGWAAQPGGGQIALSRGSAQSLVPRVLEQFERTAAERRRDPAGLSASLRRDVVSWQDVLQTDPWHVARV